MRYNIFCCSTKYHILLSSLVAHSFKNEVCILVAETTGFKGEEYLLNKYEYPIFDKVIIVHEDELFVKGIVNNLCYKKQLKKNVEKKYPQLVELNELIRGRDYRVFICEDGHPFVRYFIFQYSDIIMLEEGRAIYKKNGRKEHFLKRFLKYNILGINRPKGRSDMISEIWVQFPSCLPEDIRSKGRLLDFKGLMDGIYKSSYFNTLMSMVGMTEGVYTKVYEILNQVSDAKKVLLITQPLSEDGLLEEESKINLYKKILERYMGNLPYNVIIKPHPREKTLYQQYFEKAVIMDNSFPLEVLQFIADRRKKVIDVAITIDSTSIINIQELCVKCITVGLCDLTKELSEKYPLEHGNIVEEIHES